MKINFGFTSVMYTIILKINYHIGLCYNFFLFSFCRRAVESSFFKKSNTSKRFILFCLYGWGFAAGWTTLAVFCQSTSANMPAILRPDIGENACWFSSRYYMWSYDHTNMLSGRKRPSSCMLTQDHCAQACATMPILAPVHGVTAV